MTHVRNANPDFTRHDNIEYDLKWKGENGVWLTTDLFYEFSGDADLSKVIYTVHPYRKGYKNFYKEYLKRNDPTEYKVATEMFGGVEHWERLLKSTRILAVVEKARKELEMKLKSEALALVIADIGAKTQTANASRRYILDNLYKKETKKSVVEKKIAMINTADLFEQEQIKQDLKRLELN